VRAVSFISRTDLVFSWESLLVEVSSSRCSRGPSSRRRLLLNWIYRGARLMFGAGLIKLRGDACWRSTCLD
jgi:hypothetical protein